MRRILIALVVAGLAGLTWSGGGGVSRALVTSTVISTAQYPLALDVDAAGNVWIGYKDGPMTPKGVTVVPAATGTLFGVAVTAGVETRLFDLDGIQGILMSPAGQLFVATDPGDLYVATETATTVFGVPTTDDTLTLLSSGSFFSGGLAMDSSGNLFGARKAAGGSTVGGVGVLPAATGTLYGQSVTVNVPALLTPAGLAWGGWDGDLAIDSADNLFVNTWFTNIGPRGVYVLPKASGILYGQSVTANTLTRSAPFDGVVTAAAGIDIDDSNNIYVSLHNNDIYALSPLTRFVMGQTLTANTAAIISGSRGQTGEGLAVAPDGSSLISGALASTRRLTPAPNPPTISTSPVISGVADVGETLTASDGTWTGDPIPVPAGFQWQRCDVTGPAGVDWLTRQSVSNFWTSVTWGGPPGAELFVAVSGSGAGNRVMTSPDGITWTARTSAADNYWTSVTWGGPPGAELFVAVSGSGTGNRVMTSPDGITWTARLSAADISWTAVTWGGPSGGEVFVAVSDEGSGSLVMTSPDGIAWTNRTAANNNEWQSVTWGGGVFVAVSSSGTGNRVMTSPNGIDWTTRTSAANNAWRSVAWGGGVFVAVSSSGTGIRVMTSSNGIDWTTRTSSADNSWRSVAWGGGVFVAVSSSGTGIRVMTSPNGIDWTTRTSSADNSWNSVAWGGGVFVAVSGSGTGNRVMTSSPSLTCADIPDASGSTYLIGQSDRGKTLRAQATAINMFASVSAPSSGLGPVPSVIPPPAPPVIPPAAPVDVIAEPTLLGAKVRWSPPPDAGTSPVNFYAVRAWPGGPVCQGPASTLNCTVTGLDPTLDYYFTVVPMSGAGWGTASQPSNTIRPLAPEPPGAPRNVVVVPGDAQATVSWVPPSSVGSSPIREYRLVSSPDYRSCVVSALTCTVTGLTNGTAYTFTVEARNDQGWGPASQASAAVTPQSAGLSIRGDRKRGVVSISGTSTSMAFGSVVTVWTRIGVADSFTPAAKTVGIRPDGTFTWQRRLNPTIAIAIYVTSGSMRSDTIRLRATR